MVPAPMIYVLATAVGLLLGIVLDLAFGVPWWLGPVGVVLGVWLLFLASARKNLHQVGRQYARMTAPNLAARASEHAMEAAFREPPFPIYGLAATWTGRRFMGGQGSDGRHVTSLSLAHGDPFDESGVELRVECSIREHDSIEFCRRQAFEGLVRDNRRPPADATPDEFSVWVHRSEREIRELPDPVWERSEIRVDGRPVSFDLLTGGRRWVAVARLEHSFVMLEARGISPRDVNLERVVDASAYIEGSRAMHAERFADHDH